MWLYVDQVTHQLCHRFVLDRKSTRVFRTTSPETNRTVDNITVKKLSLQIFPATGWGIIILYKSHKWQGFSGGSMVKNLPSMQQMRVWSLGGEDSLEKEMATHSKILARRIPWTEEPCGLQSVGCKELDMTERLHHNCHPQRVQAESFIQCAILCPNCPLPWLKTNII